MRLLVTQGQLVVRFSKYTLFPCRVVLLSKRFNLDGYYDEIIDLLHCDVLLLDSGYALLLRQEAWDAGPSLTDALRFLVSSQVQEEIDTIAVSIETSTMDVERKHNLDKRSEKCTVNSAAKTSRDSFIRAWRQTPESQGLSQILQFPGSRTVYDS